MERILVTGADGRLGRAVCKALRLRFGRAMVIGCDLAPDEFRQEGPYRRIDVIDRLALFEFVQREEITCIYHLAAVLVGAAEVDPDRAWAVNFNGLINVLDAARTFGLRVFWPSSIAVFGRETLKDKCPQVTVARPMTVYGMTKLVGELRCAYYAERFGLDVRSIRLPGLIVPGATARGGMMDLIYDGVLHAIRHERYRCYLKADTRLAALPMADAVEAIMGLMEAPAASVRFGMAYNVQALDFTPDELEIALRSFVGDFSMSCAPDERQWIAEQWPATFDDHLAWKHWGYHNAFTLRGVLREMIRAVANDMAMGSVTEK